jgi:hypothetical protein
VYGKPTDRVKARIQAAANLTVTGTAGAAVGRLGPDDEPPIQTMIVLVRGASSAEEATRLVREALPPEGYSAGPAEPLPDD